MVDLYKSLTIIAPELILALVAMTLLMIGSFYQKKSINLIITLSFITLIILSINEESTFNFRKMTLQEVTVIGTYCYTNKDFEQTLKILSNKDIGPLDWIEFRELKSGGDAFKQIHDGTCVAPKIILLP